MNTTFGRYRLLERLGQGGMAEVFKAKSYGVEGFEKVVVIKRILPELAASEQFVEMFIHEAKLAVRLSHANVVQVFDLGLAPGTVVGSMPSADAYYMAMEYVSGLDLATLLARCRRQSIAIPVEMAVYVAAEVAKGLDHAHRRRDEQNQPLNIVHLDVSPQNILVSLEGEVKVTDFGIAKAASALDPAGLEDTRTRQLKGKFGYMSPEHVEGGAVDARSDLFSLGTVLYEMLAGVNPFSAPTSFETLRRVSTVEYPPVELLRAEAPPELVALLKIAMAPRPEDRFADAGRMYEALLSFLYSQGRRFSAHDLADFLARFRNPDETGPVMVLDADGGASQERTPVEIPTSQRRSYPSVTRVETSSMIPVVDVERAAGMGARREVTGLVVEVPGRDDPSLAERVAQTIRRHGGHVLASEPEQVTAIFGAADPDGRDTEVATRCALVVLRSLAGGARQPSAGLHVGRIHVSSEGVPTADERLATIVTTARDLARAREGMCAISASAMRQVRSLFVFDSLGRGAGITSSTTLLVKEVRGTSEAFGRFVGRRDELRAFGEVLATTTRRVASTLTLRGDHGVGKTRLLLEVERRLRKGGYNVGWHLAACLPRGTELPLSGIQCMIQVLCGVAEGDPDAHIRQVAPRLRALGLHDDEVAAVLTALGATTDAPLANPKGSLVNAFTQMVLRLCDDRPHAFAWDAAHCMDAESFAVLEAVLGRLPQTRALFVLAARAGFSHPLERLPVHSALDLADLGPEDGERLVAVRLGIDRVPPDLLRFVRQRAGGHPQMIEEILKALVEARAVTVADGSILTMKLASQDLSLPKTLRGLVGSRVARLDAAERAILQAAAVLGEPINSAVLAAMTGLDLTALDRSLAILRDRGFVSYTGPQEVMFVSPIVPEVVLDALTAEATREMHAAAGRALEVTLGEAAVEHAARIATHLYASGERERAGEWFARSADRRVESGQYETASRDYARAIDLCDPAGRAPQELAAWLAGLARSVRLVRTLPEAMELCERVIAQVDAAPLHEGDSLELRVRVRIDAGRILGALHLFDAARAQFAAAEAIAQHRKDLVKSTLVAAAEFSGRQGDFKRSLEHLERLKSIVTSGGDKLEEHKLLVSLVQANAAMGDHATARAYFERAAQLLPTEPMVVCERHKLRALIEYFARDFRAAVLHAERAIDMSRELGLQYEVAVNLHNMGDALVQLEDYSRAYGAFKQSLALCDELGHDRLASHNRMFLAYLDGRNGDADAERVLAQGIRYAESMEFTWDVLGGRLLLAKLLVLRGELDPSRLEFQRVRELAKAAGNRQVADECLDALRAMGAPLSQPPPRLEG
ncbi:MAG: Serine/threonine protein kinase PrkC, regulator of stationary phase [Labilithrix sp.]|nr:Serine/threonine protein kinase PrkC, regulator of stationary phase [Labilithrix sp.]